MESTQIYIHGENSREPRLIEVSEKASIPDILKAYAKEFPETGQPEEISVFVEDEEEALIREKHIEPAGIRKRGHYHCHRCKKIEVTVFYNGEDKRLPFPPSTTAKLVLKKAVRAFQINEADAGDYLLKLEDRTVLQPADHIGSFASFPRCVLKLFLTPTKPVQG